MQLRLCVNICPDFTNWVNVIKMCENFSQIFIQSLHKPSVVPYYELYFFQIEVANKGDNNISIAL